jgi:2Fe-2S ferredoxin
MTTVVFESPDAPPVAVEAAGPGRLLDLCDEATPAIPFSCRSASCGTCRVDVLEGAEHLKPPQDEELDVLAIFGDDPGERRLACQVCFDGLPGRIRVRPSE